MGKFYLFMQLFIYTLVCVFIYLFISATIYYFVYLLIPGKKKKIYLSIIYSPMYESLPGVPLSSNTPKTCRSSTAIAKSYETTIHVCLIRYINIKQNF